jgi:hypothetical protein
MELPTIPDVIRQIEAACERHGIKPTRFGRDATNNPALLTNLRDGGNPTLDTLNRIRDHIARLDLEAAARGADEAAAA